MIGGGGFQGQDEDMVEKLKFSGTSSFILDAKLRALKNILKN